MLELYNKIANSMDDQTLFAQIVKLIPRSVADPVVKKHHADKGAFKLRSRNQLLCMLFCHLVYCMSLRDISNGILRACDSLNHLGISDAPSRNALNHRDRVRPVSSGKSSAGPCIGTRDRMGIYFSAIGKTIKYRRLAEFDHPDDRKRIFSSNPPLQGVLL